MASSGAAGLSAKASGRPQKPPAVPSSVPPPPAGSKQPPPPPLPLDAVTISSSKYTPTRVGELATDLDAILADFRIGDARRDKWRAIFYVKQLSDAATTAINLTIEAGQIQEEINTLSRREYEKESKAKDAFEQQVIDLASSASSAAEEPQRALSTPSVPDEQLLAEIAMLEQKQNDLLDRRDTILQRLKQEALEQEALEFERERQLLRSYFPAAVTRV